MYSRYLSTDFNQKSTVERLILIEIKLVWIRTKKMFTSVKEILYAKKVTQDVVLSCNKDTTKEIGIVPRKYTNTSSVYSSS